MNKFKAFFVVLVFVSFKSFACLNWEIKTLKNKVEIYRDRTYQYIPDGHDFKIKDFPSIILDLENGYKRTNDVDYLSDKGYILIVQGKYDEALKLYLEIEKIKPNRYSTASNLGTLYELMGENQKSYNWIKKAIEINPKSHDESEWLHLKILEANIKELKNPTGVHFINTNFGSEIIPKTNLGDEELSKLKDGLYYQLNERISFIKPENKIISVLLFELGNIAMIENYDPESASKVYELSKKYGFRSELLNERLILCYKKVYDLCSKNIGEVQQISLREQKMNNLSSKQLAKNNHLILALICVSIISIGLLICLIVFFQKWKKLKSNTISTS